MIRAVRLRPHEGTPKSIEAPAAGLLRGSAALGPNQPPRCWAGAPVWERHMLGATADYLAHAMYPDGRLEITNEDGSVGAVGTWEYNPPLLMLEITGGEQPGMLLTRREIVWVGVAALLLLFGVIGLDGGGPLLIVGLIVVGALLIGVGIKRSRQEGADKPRLSVVTEAPAPKPRRSLPSITLDDPACPYCGAVQDPPPQRRRKCRDCGETIHTRTDQETRKRYLITATEADRLHRQQREERWKEQGSRGRVSGGRPERVGGGLRPTVLLPVR